MMISLKHERTLSVEPKIRSDPSKRTAHLTVDDIMALMEHDSYRRVKGRVRQKIWALYR